MNGVALDKKGCGIRIDSVLFDGSIYWQTLKRDENYMLLSCERGYLHNPSLELLRTMTIIGKFEDNKHLFNCD